MDEFNPSKVLGGNIKDITAGLSGMTFAQIKALEETERGKGAEARTNLLKALQAEIEAKRAASPAVDLSDASVDRIAGYVLCEPGDTPNEDQRAEIRAMFIVSPHSEDYGDQHAVINAMALLLVEIEQLEAALANRPGDVVPAGQVADRRRAPERLLAAVTKLAFCDSDGRELFKLPVKPNHFSLRGRKAAYAQAVTLHREKPLVAVKEVVALDSTGRPVSRVSWPTPLVGGGGKLAEFPAGHIAFDL